MSLQKRLQAARLMAAAGGGEQPVCHEFELRGIECSASAVLMVRELLLLDDHYTRLFLTCRSL